MKISICTDLEGVTGVFDFKQTREHDAPEFREAMRLLMGDIAAVAQGLKEAATPDTPWYTEGECVVRAGLDIVRGSENRP